MDPQGNWRATQGASGAIGDPTMESGDWRTQLQADSRQRIVNKIMDTLKRHLPFSGQEGLQELKKIALRFEEKIYTAATSQSDYLRKISLKMLTMETRSQNPMSDAMQANSTGNSVNPSDPGSQVMQQMNQGQQLPISVPSNNIQQGQQMMSQSMHNNIGSNGMQGSSTLSSGLPPGSGLQQPPIANVAGQNSNLQNIQNMSNAQQNTVGNTMGNNNFANQRQIPGRQQLVPQQQPQQQPQAQNSHYLYQQQLQQIAKQKLQPSPMQQHNQQPQQPQQQNMLQQGHLQPSQQSVMQPTMMQTSSLSTVVQNQQPVVSQSSQPLMNHQQSVLRQPRQQQGQPIQQQVQPTQQNQMGQQTNATNMQQNQLIGQQNNYSDMQQQQQRLIGQKNKLSSLQQPQQQLIGQHNNLSGMQQQSSGQQQQLLGNQSGNTSMQTNQHSVQQMLQSNKMPIQQQNQQTSANMLPAQVQQSQPQLQQQVMPHMQSQPGQLQQQQQVGMQQPNMLQRDMQQRLPTAGGFQQQNVIDQQKQLFQQQRVIPEASSTSLDSTAQTGNPNGGDWQEEVYQKIKAMKELYLPDLNDMHHKILSKLQQHDSLPQQPKNEQLEKLKVFKNMLERFMQFLQIPKQGILANYKDKLGTYEKQIINVINSNRRKPAPPQQQAQALPPPHMQSMQQSQQTHSQLTQVQSHENQMNLQGSMAPMQPNNMGNMQQNPSVSLSGVSNGQQNMMSSIQPGSNLDPGQNNNMNSLQQVSSGSLQQNAVSGAQQVNINPLSLQGNSNMLQHQHIKQQEQLLQNQQLKQLQQRQLQQQFLHKQQFMQQQQQQQFHQQTKQQLTGNQLSQLPQISDGGDVKLRQQMNVKPGGFQHAAAQRSAYHQQLKPGAPFSPQLLSAASPQMSQHASPQIDQSNMFKSANSPFAVPSPSTSSASPLPGDFERINGVSSLSNVGNIGHQQPSSSVLPNQIGTPGISASPLLEFTSPDVNNGLVPSMGPGKSTATEPLERLLKAVKSISPTALSASVSDIGSVVSMIDRIAGSAPGNGSRAAVGEDLVAMTKCRLQARNFATQDGTNGIRKMKRFTSAMPLNVVSSAGSVNDSFKQLNVETSELDSTASSAVKRPRTETNHALLEEIRDINRGLIDTVVAVSDEDVDPAAATAASEGGDGTVVKCSFSAVALGPNLKSQYASAQMSPIQPLRLLVPANYPNCSPMLLDKFPAEVSKEFEDLSTKTKSRFSISLRSLSQPMSLKEIARTWDVCARGVISEYTQQSGGGTFSSKYGTWENCLSAA
ncbi:mediator of RNA polymerase II transcription subunit 15a-like [Bidens hawaiensis]|uniref:mediator of RNA polymerase II transcription subunit 15a-like n=1 Tax=Bidens hawaiensis TaxID=980011 RepID=UPI00404BA2A6